LILGPWCANEEEDPKSPFNGCLEAYQVAIDFREPILSVQSIISVNQQTDLTGDRRDSALPEARHAPPW